MLTKDLLEYRILKGRVRPSYVNAADPLLLALAESLVGIAAAGAGTDRGDLEERLEAAAQGSNQPKIAPGLVKLVLDRMTFEEPEAEAPGRRREAFLTAAKTLRALPDDARPEAWETSLKALTEGRIETIRDSLYADHPDNRRLLEWKPIEAKPLLDRYNLALVQGLLFRANRVTVRAFTPELLRVRRLLRWLKWHRLVAEVTQDGGDWTLEVEGPAAILQMQKKYGLQLALFAAAVPILERWELTATLTFDRGREAVLHVDHTAPLVAPDAQALGHVPEEIDVIVQKLSDGPWELDLTPVPRPVGVRGVCVPDLAARSKDGTRAIAIEFFHRWHKHALHKRLDDLRIRADAGLVLAVDESLGTEELPLAALEAHPQVLTFKGFPSERKLRALLGARLG